ncbi:unnamed protein product, partial [Prunus brigantina]
CIIKIIEGSSSLKLIGPMRWRLNRLLKKVGKNKFMAITMEEIKEAAMQIGGLKAPGPNGYQGIFFHKYWDTIYDEVRGITEDFFLNNQSLGALNITNLVLIPKIPNPEGVSHFRPISLCNFSFKIVSKVMPNRLKVFLPQIISPAQNAFVPNRQIQENILIAHEAFHILKLRKTIKMYDLGIKLDMNKAYDRVEWHFLESVMLKMGFDVRWVNLVMNLVRTVQFSLVLNGVQGNTFTPTRGIRQGDPLSPYLFLIVSEVLSLMIKKACDANYLQGGALRLAPSAFIDRNATVETIIDWNSRTWKLDIIRPLLSTEEALAIQRIPIGSSSEVDRLVWPDEKDGKYSVNEGLSLKHLITYSTTRSIHPSAQASWVAPSEPFVKINVDAAWRKSTCRAGVGIIIRNFEGRFLRAKSVDFQAENALIAEATALWEGCKFAKERGHNMVCFESDSLELIKSVCGSFGRGSWTLYPILTLIRDEQRYFEECRWNWTTRNCNQAADHLASLALLRKSTEV